jgi:2-(1,2-epoxy-1,2-dihydrophenyl)acetyl-CoA isomerase
MPGDYGGAWLWTQILGSGKARQLYLIDEKRDAAAALAFGLIDRIYDDAALKPETMALAIRLAGLPQTGLAYAKANLNAAPDENLAQSLDRESLNMMLARNALIEARKARETQA